MHDTRSDAEDANANRSQIVALAGFDPIQIQSGTLVHGKSRISKRGNREVRRRLYEATRSAARYNPSIRAIYRRLKEAGKPEKVARAAAARKLHLIVHAICKSGQFFRESPQQEAGYSIRYLTLAVTPAASQHLIRPWLRPRSEPLAWHHSGHILGL